VTCEERVVAFLAVHVCELKWLGDKYGPDPQCECNLLRESKDTTVRP